MKTGKTKDQYGSEKGPILVPLLLCFALSLLTLWNPPIIDEYLETLLVDYRFKIRNLFDPPRTPDDILIVAVDEKSLTEYGRWPWSRQLQSELIRKIFQGRPGVVGVDIFYSEPESGESDKVLGDLFQTYSDRLVVALGCEVEAGRVFDGEVDESLYEIAVSKIHNLKLLHPIEACRVLLPPESISGSAAFGHVYSLPDRDGKLRWEVLYLKYGDEYLPSFALQTARVALGVDESELIIVGGGGVSLGERFVPTDISGRAHINFFGKEGSFHQISASDLLSDRISSELFRDKIVLVGTSAISTYDLKTTPFSANLTGVEKNATVIANIINGSFIKRAPFFLFIDFGVVCLSGVLAVLLLRKRNALFSSIVLISLLVFLVCANQLVFSLGEIRLNLTYPLLTLLLVGSYLISNKYFREEKKSKKIQQMFSNYVTERVVRQLMEKPELAKLGGERREVTVLFSDIKGFTSFSETHAPEKVVEILNEYLEAMTDVVFQWEGTLDKFIGDAIMVFWGAPLEQKNHAELAVKCALHMINRLEQLQEKWQSEGQTPFDIGIGINTGEVLVGNIGAEEKKMDYTLIGDHVNLGARVERLTRKYDSHILITEYTLEKIRALVDSGSIAHVSIKGLEQVVVKGKEKSVGVYTFESIIHGDESGITAHEDRVVRLQEK